jgi:MSHA biogenesis protein MshP
MYPNVYPNLKNKQRGFLIPVALFIVIGLGALAVAIARMGAGTQSAVIQEAISVQALLAADSGVQYALNQLLFDATSRTQVDARCIAIDPQSISFIAVGLAGCIATLDCQQVSNTGGTARIYQLQSSAVCGSGDLMTHRIVAVKASYGE